MLVSFVVSYAAVATKSWYEIGQRVFRERLLFCFEVRSPLFFHQCRTMQTFAVFYMLARSYVEGHAVLEE